MVPPFCLLAYLSGRNHDQWSSFAMLRRFTIRWTEKSACDQDLHKSIVHRTSRSSQKTSDNSSPLSAVYHAPTTAKSNDSPSIVREKNSSLSIRSAEFKSDAGVAWTTHTLPTMIFWSQIDLRTRDKLRAKLRCCPNYRDAEKLYNIHCRALLARVWTQRLPFWLLVSMACFTF